jgi:hypothetical protein
MQGFVIFALNHQSAMSLLAEYNGHRADHFYPVLASVRGADGREQATPHAQVMPLLAPGLDKRL